MTVEDVSKASPMQMFCAGTFGPRLFEPQHARTSGRLSLSRSRPACRAGCGSQTRGPPPLTQSAAAEFTFESPGFSSRGQRFSQPMKRLAGDFLKTPACLRPVRPHTELNDVPSLPTANLIFVMIACRVSPGDAPRLNCCIPKAKSGPVHVHLFVEGRMAFRARRHDPQILNGAALEHPRRVNFGLDGTGRNIDGPIMQDIQVPASHEPAIDILRLRNFRRTTRVHQGFFQNLRFRKQSSIHKSFLCFWRGFAFYEGRLVLHKSRTVLW